MGVVRREGDWRLEKQDEGLYEITYEQQPQMKVLTGDYEAGMFDDPTLDPIPVREVDSFSEAKQLFEETAESGSPGGMGVMGGMSESPIGDDMEAPDDPLHFGGEVDDEDVDLPPGGIALVLILAGGIALASLDYTIGSTVFFVSMALVVGGIAILGWAGVIYKTAGFGEAAEFLLTVDEEEAENAAESSTEKTPPTPEKLKNDLIFDRADQQCEWCEESFDHPHVHHIKPRREGGPNDPDNLVVLCPNCHEKADRNAIPRSKLKAKVSRLMEE